jgi:hypothetical protein
MTGDTTNNTFSQVKESFTRWIDIIKKMHQITDEYFDPYKNFYEKEFSEYFKNDDDDAAVNPFELERQEFIYHFLVYAENKITSFPDITDADKRELIKEVAQLKEDVPKLTKKRFVSALSKFAKNTKKISNKLFHEVFDVMKKEAIKVILYEGVKQIPHVVHTVKDWINLITE